MATYMGFTFFFLNLLATLAFAGETRINYGLVEETYPESGSFYGEVPRGQGITLGIRHQRELSWAPVGAYFITLEANGKLEADAQKYDPVRDPYSIEGSFEIVKPILERIVDDSLAIVGGGTLEMNGPQINDNYRDLYIGLAASKKIKTTYGDIRITATLGHVKYFYEVDDEPAKLQTGTPRQMLAHEGVGALVRVQVDYQVGENKLRLSFSEIGGSDYRQHGNYEKKVVAVGFGRDLSKNTSCEIELKVTQHQYSPKALAFADRMNSTHFKCSKRF